MKKLNIKCTYSELLPLASITPIQGDLKDLSKDNAARFKKQMIDNGFISPIHIWKNNGSNYILDGTQRSRVLGLLEKEGYDMSGIPCIFINCKDEKDAKRKVLALTSQYGTMTDQGLYEFMSEAEINATELIESFNFPEIDMDKFMQGYFKDELPPEIDEIPEIDRSKITVKLGDIYELGDHRLICGDCMNCLPELLDGENVDLLLTDVPYGVSYADKNRFLNAFDKGNRVQEPIIGDDQSPQEMYEFWFKAFTACFGWMKENASFYVFGPAGSNLLLLLKSLEAADYQIKHMLVWVKNNHVLGRCDYHYKHEPIIYGWIKRHNFYGGSSQFSVWEYDKPLKNDLHPTMKPVELLSKAVENSSKPGDNVLDVFGGSGGTLIACEQLKRKCFMVEIDPYYVQIILERWSKLTGEKWKKIS